ncbi:peroxide stress protein YaaA [Streptomyces sp. ACA25]|uniref:peroxide stress protein YaaA n=1 Tax=Streptomyces sp. ACA25 TaxID=3022596 RepID=UPI0023076662|nr:peroxide stress protein YaaA [Streptomyces sp. ACA25]MDB1087801.1 peroxide stress protein YaaA [Streptomyces sp. ACA25]
MLVLLPPSEGKAEGFGGPPLDLGGLSLPGLTPARETVLAELVDLCSGDPEKARGVLGLSERQAGEITKNAALRTAPARPAGEIYTGVLYDALGLATLGTAARERAGRALLVFSGLWGAVRVSDLIPSYRCPVGTRLPGTGGLAGLWRPVMAEVLPEAAGSGLVLDLRSAAYAGMWKPKGGPAERTVTVRVLQAKVVDGTERRSVVSHFNKATKGRIVRALLESGAQPRSATGLADVLRDLGHTVEMPDDAGPRRLDVIVREL